MVTQTKTQERIKSDVHDLLMKSKINGLDLIHCLFYIRIILKKIDKISIVKNIEINNKLKELETGNIDALKLLQENLRFGTLKNRFRGRPNSIKEETELRKQSRKKIDNIERLKAEVEEWAFKSVKLLQDLNYEKGAEIAEVKRIEIKLEALKTSKAIINAFKKLIIPKKYLHLILKIKSKIKLKLKIRA